MRINRSRTKGSLADRFGMDRSWVNDNLRVLEFVEMVGPSIVLCGPDLPEIMEGG